MSNLARVPQAGFALTVLNGAEKGVTYQLVAGRVSIGRGNENNIIIKDDPKISRNHAVITVASNGVEISDVSDRNKVLVGEEEITTRLLRTGDIIHLGNTKFQFKVLSQASDIDLLSRVSARQGIDSMTPAAKTSNQTRRRPDNNFNFYIIIGVIGILFAWLLSSNAIKKSEVKIRTEEDIQTNINSNQKIIDDVEAEKIRSGTGTKQYEEAQPNFIRGFRDYRKGQYDRAIESFQACLSLFSAHPQCQRYLSLSEKKFHELIQYHMVLANKYRSQNQFSACKASYRNAMVMIKNPADKIYIEAKSGLDACRALEGDRF